MLGSDAAAMNQRAYLFSMAATMGFFSGIGNSCGCVGGGSGGGCGSTGSKICGWLSSLMFNGELLEDCIDVMPV